jgi:peptidoglycan/xylan/chitin deacetylase (PgdA/CDA1 family)
MSDAGRWPNKAKSAAVFSFDVDDEYVMRRIFGNQQSYYITQGQYDLRAGIWRVLNLLQKEDVKATFCVVGKIAETRPDVVLAIKEGGHELATHGLRQ